LKEAYGLGKVERALAIDKLQARTKWPRHAFHQMAQDMGLSFNRREWTAEDDAYLQERIGVMAVRAISRALKRSMGSVRARAARLELSERVKEGYNISDLVAVLGVSPGTVGGWMRRGLLGAVQERAGLRTSEDAVVQFLRRYPGEYDLRRVDQVWFKSMIFSAARSSSGQPRSERSSN
jgi:hypothetical protein